MKILDPYEIIAAMGSEYEKRRRFFEDFKRRRLGILTDDGDAESRAVLVAPAEGSTPEAVNEIIALTGGLFFVAMNPKRVSAFLLEKMTRPMTSHPLSDESTEFDMCVSVEAREGVTTGISAADRAQTISILGEENPVPRKLVKPGHIFPVQTREGGVLVRNTLAEGALDIVTRSGFTDAALYVDLLGTGGTYLNFEGQQKLSQTAAIPHITLSDLVRYFLESEKFVYRVAEAKLPTSIAGELRAFVYKSSIHEGEHLALTKGDITTSDPVLTRVQTEFTFSDVFGGAHPPSRFNIDHSLQAINERGRGIIIYLRRPVEGQLREQIRMRQTKHEKPSTMMREYGLGAQILRDLGVRQIELLTNSKKNLVGLTTFGIDIVSQMPVAHSEI